MENMLQQFQEIAAYYMVKIIAAVIILIIGSWTAKLVKKIIAKILQKKQTEETLSSFVCNLSYYLLLACVVLAALAKLGVQTTTFIAIIGAAGLAVGLALQGALANFAAGFLMLIFRPFKAGDYISGGGVNGSVEHIHIFTTQLTTPDNKVVIVPNAKIMNDCIINYSAKDIRRVDMLFGAGYGDDLHKVKQTLQAAADSESRILTDPAAVIVLKELADSSINFEVRAWVKKEDYWSVYFDMMENVKRRFDAEGICIPFPQRDVHLYEHKQATG